MGNPVCDYVGKLGRKWEKWNIGEQYNPGMGREPTFTMGILIHFNFGIVDHVLVFYKAPPNPP